MSPQVKPTSRGLVIVTAGVAGSGRCTLGTEGIIKFDVTELRVSVHPLLTLAVHIPVRPVDRKKLATFL